MFGMPLPQIAAMKHPSFAEILRRGAYGYEADRMDELTNAFDQAQQKEKEKKDGKRNTHRTR